MVDHYLTLAVTHCLTVLLYNWQVQWQFAFCLLVASCFASILGYGLALKYDQDQFIALVSGLEKTPRKAGVVPCEEHKNLVEPHDEFISVETLK